VFGPDNFIKGLDNQHNCRPLDECICTLTWLQSTYAFALDMATKYICIAWFNIAIMVLLSIRVRDSIGETLSKLRR
jgi:hypothetical protein